ncbi:ejaculatory bulb-specific protein 3-like [Phymastichus coffea]|uniref:ejaculatory bulb-specific protein 3-like n=1 Tax=Phymastichus coffea TaxID=108790 RepID=UPI00273B13EB|nr:ejaculatory bulb-specific protein 3-like [Phymastichus coffea]
MSPKRSLIVAAAAILLHVVGVAGADKKYDSKYDDLDVEAILHNDAERNIYYACFMDTGPCPNEAAIFFKGHAPEAVVTSCKYCTQKQLEMFEKIVSWFVDNSPQEWNALIEKTINDARKQGLNF